MRRLAAQTSLWVLALFSALGWYYLAPPAVGGSTTYVATDGVSMLPRFHGGDLAIVRAESSYRIGEIVAYRSRMLHTIVLHRIVGRIGDRYVFKGDNNDFLDLEHPARSQLVGKLWLHVPGLGKQLGSLHNPGVTAALAMLATLLLLGGAFEHRRRQRRRRGRLLDEPRPPTTDWRSPVLMAGLAAVVPFGLLALLAFGRPTRGPVPVSVPYKQSGSFTYSAAAPAGTAYPAGHAATGDPLFLKLVDAVQFGFRYRFGAGAAHHVSGTASLAATLASSTGWSRTLPLARTTRFSGDTITLHGALRLASLSDLQQQLQTATGTPASYTLTVRPAVHVRGSAGGLPVDASFGTPLAFSFDLYELQPIAAGDGGASAKAALAPSTSGSATGTRIAPTVVSFGPLHAGVSGVRRLSALGLGAALLCLLLGYPAGVARLRKRTTGEAARIRARYSRLIVPIARLEEVQARRVVHVSDMDALARVAERYERMILHEHRGGRDSFCVSDDGVLYRYVVERAA